MSTVSADRCTPTGIPATRPSRTVCLVARTYRRGRLTILRVRHPRTRRRRIIGQILLLAQPDRPLPVEVCYLVVGLAMVALGLLTLGCSRASGSGRAAARALAARTMVPMRRE
jgi:hypothetical protein